MAKTSAVERNLRIKRTIDRDAGKREKLKKAIKDKNITPEERLALVAKLAKLPVAGSRVRFRNRCALTGRPRGNYRRFGICRIKIRDLGNFGKIPGLVKSSW